MQAVTRTATIGTTSKKAVSIQVPTINGKEFPLKVGFTKTNELFVGRLAMLGFASSLIGEVSSEHAQMLLLLPCLHRSPWCIASRKYVWPRGTPAAITGAGARRVLLTPLHRLFTLHWLKTRQSISADDIKTHYSSVPGLPTEQTRARPGAAACPHQNAPPAQSATLPPTHPAQSATLPRHTLHPADPTFPRCPRRS
jgi:hypothetical protein